MSKSGGMNDDVVGRLIPEIVANDDEIRARVRRLVLKCVDEMEEMLFTGPPNARMQLVKALIPQVAKVLEKQEEEAEEMVQLREEFTELRKELKAG